MPNDVRCEKCWRPAFQLPCGTVFIVYPRTPQGQQEKYVTNLCIAHIRIFREWMSGSKIRLPKGLDEEQQTLKVNPS